MWLFTQHGFYSVIVDGANREYVFVRAHAARHLENLRTAFGVDEAIAHAPAAAYPYVLRVKRQRWLSLAMDLASDVKYTNYETAASKHMAEVGPRFVRGLQEVKKVVGEVFRSTTSNVS